MRICRRAARSNIWALTTLGADVTLCGPSTLVPRSFADYDGVSISYDLKEAIRDADVAEEISAFTRSQILTQAATAMVAQANALPQNALTLLQ